MLRLVEQLVNGSFSGEQEISQGLTWGTALKQHGGYKGFSNSLVRHRPASQKRLAVKQNGGPAERQLVH